MTTISSPSADNNFSWDQHAQAISSAQRVTAIMSDVIRIAGHWWNSVVCDGNAQAPTGTLLQYSSSSSFSTIGAMVVAWFLLSFVREIRN
jgi:hypothetical protein